MFQRDDNFKTGLQAFVTENRGDLLLDIAEFLPRQRNEWQRELKTFRNEYLEHRDARRRSAGGEVLRTCLGRKGVRPCMADGCRVIVFLLETRFPPQASITDRTTKRPFSRKSDPRFACASHRLMPMMQAPRASVSIQPEATSARSKGCGRRIRG